MPTRSPASSRAARTLRSVGMDPSRPLLESRSGSVLCKGLVVGQSPNAPLAISLLGALASRATSGASRSALKLVALIAMAAWGCDELARGANWFRRALGAGALALAALRTIDAARQARAPSA